MSGITKLISYSTTLAVILATLAGCGSTQIRDSGGSLSGIKVYEPTKKLRADSKGDLRTDLENASYIIVVDPSGEQKIYGNSEEGYVVGEPCSKTAKGEYDQCVAYSRKQMLVDFQNLTTFTTVGSPTVTTIDNGLGGSAQICIDRKSRKIIDCSSID